MDLLAPAIACMGGLGIAMSFVSRLAPEVVRPSLWLFWGSVMTGDGALLGFVSGIRFVRWKLQKGLLEDSLGRRAADASEDFPDGG